MRIKLIAIGLLLVILVKNVFSQRMSLTYEELIKLTLENNLIIKTYQAKVEQWKLKEKEIFLGMLPQFKISGRYSRLSEIEPFIIQLPFVPGSPELKVYEPVEEQYFSRVSVEFPLFTGFRQLNSLKAHQKFVDAANDELKKIKSEVLFNSKMLYLKLFLAYRTMNLIESNIEYLEEQKKIAEDFFKNRLIQQNDILKIDIVLTRAKISFYDNQNIIRNLNLSLCQILNIDQSTTIKPIFDPGEFSMELDDHKISEKIRPDILALENIIKANQRLKKATIGSLLPSIFFNAGYDYAKPNPKYFPVKNEWKYTWDVNLVAQFNFWDWLLPLNRAKQVELQIQQIEYQLSQLKKQSENEIIDLLNRLENEKNKESLLEKELNFALENQRIVGNKYKEGLATTTELIDANRQRIEAELKLEESKINIILLNEELKKHYGLY